MNHFFYQALQLLYQLTSELYSQIIFDQYTLFYQGLDGILIDIITPIFVRWLPIPIIKVAVVALLLCILPDFLISAHTLVQSTIVEMRQHIRMRINSANKVRYKSYLIISMLIMSLWQCTPDRQIRPITADQYIVQFDAFILKVEQHKTTYDAQDWLLADEAYRAYSRKYFAQFSDQLTSEQKDYIYRLKIKYHACKGANTIEKALEGLEDQFLELQNNITEKINN